MKTLIAYFSASGRTKKAAEQLAKITGGELFEIRTKTPYPDSYFKKVKIGSAEIKSNARPVLDVLADISAYDRILLGFPIWFGTCPMAVLSFLDSVDMTGKKIYPFCTSGASGVDKSKELIARSCKGDVKDGRRFGKIDAEAVKVWLK